MRSSFRRPLLGAAGLVGIVLCWALIRLAFRLSPDILPTPSSVVLALADANWLALLASTFASGLAGWLVGGIAGFSIGTLMAGSRTMEHLALPWVRLFGGVAGLAVAPLLLYWTGLDGPSRLVLGAWLAVFPVAIAAHAGLRRVPPYWQDVMRGLSASRMETIVVLRVPAALPALCAGGRRAWTLALAGVVIAEFLGAPGGLGQQIAFDLATFDVTGAIAGLIVLAAVGGAIEFLLRWAEQWIKRRVGPVRVPEAGGL
jgi:NitT/TauT family transport system permease protein